MLGDFQDPALAEQKIPKLMNSLSPL
jgi:hypothetical protein